MELDLGLCCPDFYAQPAVRELLGDSFHPGGPALSRRTVQSLAARPGNHALDVACGIGTTVELLSEHGPATGVDASPDNIARARARAEDGKHGARARFVVGDAAALPFDDASFDLAVCECALSTFPRPGQALAELRRVLRPGGRLGLSDMTLAGRLPPRLATLAGPWACLQGAVPAAALLEALEAAGFEIEHCHDEREALQASVVDLKRRLVALGLSRVVGLTRGALDLGEARRALDEAKAEVERGTVGYVRVVARSARAS